MLRVVVSCGLGDREWTIEVQMISLVQDLYLGETLEYFGYGRSIQVGHVNADRPSFRIGRGAEHPLKVGKPKGVK